MCYLFGIRLFLYCKGQVECSSASIAVLELGSRTFDLFNVGLQHLEMKLSELFFYTVKIIMLFSVQ